MDELRWILLGLGVLIVGGVYGFTHWQGWRADGFPWQRGQRQRNEREPFADNAPGLDENDPLFDESPDDIIGSVKVTAVDSAEPVIADTAPEPEPEPAPEPEPESAPTLAPQSATAATPGSMNTTRTTLESSANTLAHERPVPPFLRRRDAKPAEEKPSRPAKKAKSRRAEPSIAETPPAPANEPETLQPALDLGDPVPGDAADVIDDQGEEKIIALSVMAPTGQPWQGDKLAECLAGQGLQLDAQGVFRCTRGQGEHAVSLYTIANIVEPGTFDANALEGLSTPGVVFIMQLPGRFDAQAAFEQMLSCAKALAEALQGQVLDGRRCNLTQQALEHMREELREYRRRAHLAGRRQD